MEIPTPRPKESCGWKPESVLDGGSRCWVNKSVQGCDSFSWQFQLTFPMLTSLLTPHSVPAAPRPRQAPAASLQPPSLHGLRAGKGQWDRKFPRFITPQPGWLFWRRHRGFIFTQKLLRLQRVASAWVGCINLRLTAMFGLSQNFILFGGKIPLIIENYYFFSHQQDRGLEKLSLLCRRSQPVQVQDAFIKHAL